jgi:hypothetical protein
MRFGTVLLPLLLGMSLLLTGCPDDKDNVDLGGNAVADNGNGSSSGGNSSDDDDGGNADGDNGDNGDNDSDKVGEPVTRNRYALNNQCFAIRANDTDRYLVRSEDGSYQGAADSAKAGEPFFMKPATLGQYLIFDSESQLLAAASPAATNGLDSPKDDNIWTVKGVGDDTDYPATPKPWTDPTVEAIDGYREFEDPQTRFEAFTLGSDSQEQNLATDANGALTIATASDSASGQSFSFAKLDPSDCAEFPEAQSNTVGETFKGTTADGSVLGMADVHVHISATEFLGRAEWGSRSAALA